jgi:glycosyltransferase involved in cell wall biosynthesis
MPSRIAFVVATRDRPGELGRLWRSLLAQTRLPDEVVIVDASGRPVPPADPAQAPFRLRYLTTPVASATRQRNIGLGAVDPAIGLVGFLDDDAVLEERAVAEMLRFFDEFGPELGGAAFNLVNHPPLALAAFKRTPFAESLGLYGRRAGVVTASGFQTMIGRVEATAWTDWLPTTASVWRREIFRGHRFDEWYSGYSYLEDLDFSYRVGRVYRLAVAASARYSHLPAAGGRGDGYAFGLREVLNRVHFVRKNPELSLAKCRLALVARLLMTAAAGLLPFEPAHLARAWGNVIGLARPFERDLAGRGRRAVLVYGQVPPPLIGSNVMTANFLEAVRKSGREAVLSRKSLSGAVDEINRIRPVKVFRLFATWARFARNLRRVRPDLAVVFSSSTLIGLTAESVILGLCRLAGVPYALYFHTDVHRRVAAAPFPLRPLLAAGIRSAAACLVLGPVFRDEIAGLRPNRVFVLPNCADAPAGPAAAGSGEGTAKVLFLSTIEASKGIMTLLEAVPLVLAAAPGVTFSVIGPWKGSAIRREVEAFLAAKNLNGSVSLDGEAFGDRKAEVLGRHDIFVLPSRREAMSLAVLEAMRASLPVVATDVGAMSEAVVDGVTGFLVPPGDPEALAGRILRLARNASLRSAMGRAGRARYEREFTPAVYERNVRAIVEQLTSGRAAS